MGVRETTKNAKIAKVRLGDVCSINMGQSPDSKSYNSEARGLPFYQGNADFGDDHPTPRVWCDTPTKVAEVGEILISVRAPIGALNFANERCCIGRGLASLNPSSEIIPRYLYYSLRSKNEELNLRGTGSTFKAINKKSLATVEFFLPSLPEQRRIAEELDQICELKKNAEERLALMDRLVKSRFVEMFGECEDLVSLDQVGQIFTGSTPPMKISEYYDSDDIPFVKPSDLSFEISQIVTSDCFLSKKAEPVVRMFDPGAVLVTCIGATIGKMGVARVRGTCNQQINFVVPSSKIKPEFLALALQSKKDELVRSANSTAVPILNKSQFSKIQLPLPPIGEQRKFAAFVAEVDKSKFVLRETVARMETLYKAKLQEYFG